MGAQHGGIRAAEYGGSGLAPFRLNSVIMLLRRDGNAGRPRALQCGSPAELGSRVGGMRRTPRDDNAMREGLHGGTREGGTPTHPSRWRVLEECYTAEAARHLLAVG